MAHTHASPTQSCCHAIHAAAECSCCCCCCPRSCSALLLPLLPPTPLRPPLPSLALPSRHVLHTRTRTHTTLADWWGGGNGRSRAVRVPPHPPPIPQACTRAPACRYVVHTAAAVETSSRHPERIIQPAVMGVSKQGVGWIEQRPSLTGSRAAQLPSCLPRFAALPSTARGPTLPPHPLRPSTTAAQAAHVLGAVNRTPSVQRVVMTSSVAAVFNSSNPRGHVYTGGVHMSGGCGGGWGGGRGGVENPRTPHPTLRDAPAPSACGHPPLPPPPHMMARRGGLEPGD